MSWLSRIANVCRPSRVDRALDEESRFVETMLFEVAARDVSSLALPLGTLLLAALVEAAVPAWRAARVDPVIALRNE